MTSLSDDKYSLIEQIRYKHKTTLQTILSGPRKLCMIASKYMFLWWAVFMWP